jgi:hypothetical protein
MAIVNLVTPRDGAKHDLKFNKPGSVTRGERIVKNNNWLEIMNTKGFKGFQEAINS